MRARKWTALAEALRRYDVGIFGLYRDDDLNLIEHTIHELAHGATFGLDLRNSRLSSKVSARFEWGFLHDRPQLSDILEFKGLAIEILVLRRLGMPLGKRRQRFLVNSADLRYYLGRGVKRVRHARVAREMRKPEIRRWADKVLRVMHEFMPIEYVLEWAR